MSTLAEESINFATISWPGAFALVGLAFAAVAFFWIIWH